jgi:hypothetical protein
MLTGHIAQSYMNSKVSTHFDTSQVLPFKAVHERHRHVGINSMAISFHAMPFGPYAVLLPKFASRGR